MHKNLSFKHVLLTTIFLLCTLIVLRFIHLDADTPLGISAGIGAYVDEGYKTLASRNLFQFGSPHWNQADDYPTWINKSPLTQWSYYGAFRILGEDVVNARVVTIFYFCLFLLGYVWAQFNRYPKELFFAGLVALGLDSALFFYSRIALFEIPLITFFYFLIFTFARKEKSTMVIDFGWILLVGAFLTFAIKKSAMLYLLPVLFGAVLYYLSSGKIQRQKYRYSWIFWTIVVIGVAILAYLTSDIWIYRLRISPLTVASRILGNKAVPAVPFVVICGLFVTLHTLLSRPDLVAGDRYRSILVSIVLLGPVTIALFRAPLRFYVPIIPAYILVVLEWFYMKGWEFEIQEKSRRIIDFIVFPMLICLAFYIGVMINHYVLSQIQIGDDPGLSNPVIFRFFTPIAVIVAVVVWMWRRIAFSKRVVIAFTSVAAALFLIKNFYTLGSFFVFPSYESKNIRNELSKLVKKGESITGDWAPFLTMGTEIKSLYSDKNFNRGLRVKEYSPDYFLYSDSPDSDIWVEELNQVNDVALGTPIYRSEYLGKNVVLYPLIYK